MLLVAIGYKHTIIIRYALFSMLELANLEAVKSFVDHDEHSIVG